ncbi:Patatin-like phospholipase [compost metagenome]
MTNQAGSKPTANRPVFLALQGGGARGIVHIGGLIAINDLELDILGVSGTSAGSMIAALVAVGYKGLDLVDPDASDHIFSKQLKHSPFKSPRDLFSKGGWRLLRYMRWATDLPGWIRSLFDPKKHRLSVRIFFRALAALLRTYGLLAIAAVMLASYAFLERHPGLAFLSAFAAVVLGGLASQWLVMRVLAGLTTVDKVHDFIDFALKSKLEEKVDGGTYTKPVTFKDLHDAKCISLKIIATNATTESLELFCYEKTPDVPVAQAVAASICLPVIFKPREFEFERKTIHRSEKVFGKFLDGGLVSNLPAWPFDEERLLHPDVPTIAFNLAPGEHDSNKHWIPAVLGAVVNGTGEIDTRATGKIIKVSIPTSLKMLDFHVSAETVYGEVAEPVVQISDKLLEELHDAPKALRAAAHELSVMITDLLKAYDGELHLGLRSDHRVRVAIAVQRGDSMRSISTVSFAGYEAADPDYDLTTPLDSRYAGLAWVNGASFDLRTEPAGRPAFGPGVFAGEKVWTELQWLLCQPVKCAPEPGNWLRPCVVIVDSNIPFEHGNPEITSVLDDFVTGVSEMIQDYNSRNGIARFVQGANTWL